MENNFKKVLDTTREKVNSLVNADSPTTQIEEVSGIGKELDNLSSEYDKLAEENRKLKDMVINQVKATGFKATGGEDNPAGGERSLDDIILEASNKLLDKK